ncbi:MAG: hypothetical protein ACYDD0_04035 [Candidatus Dormibacteria bacterium]
MNARPDFLYARPSFLEGVARLIDFAGFLNQYNTSLTEEQADRLALTMDWAAVAAALRDTTSQVTGEVDRQLALPL